MQCVPWFCVKFKGGPKQASGKVVWNFSQINPISNKRSQFLYSQPATGAK